ncbi:MAG: HDOD domain-containing protein [Ignavibacteriales bacterium]|nr:HDOD domain-containing protein [Ignavibacteriota bacterium]MCB0747061.1 HDOD domain-containing protein [Ignavibacteriota bacterium]MCB9248042.1 HDOD domain-containing protein [Ignavibacteriales bacterium]
MLSSVYNVPSIPQVVMEVNNIIDDPKTSASILGRMISTDQGLVTKILTVANSPLHGIPRRVATIDFAIVVLGFNQVKNIVLALSMMESLKIIGDTKFDQKKYWLHSILTAAAAKKIADDLGYQASGEVFTAGLLHDLGIPIIYKFFNNEYKQIISSVSKEKISFLEAEEKFLGLTHQEVGKFLIDRWNLPIAIADVINFHHKPSEAENNRELTALVHLADFMTTRLMIGDFNWDSSSVLDPEIIEILRLGDTEYLENFIFSYRELFQEQIELINL